MTSKKIATIAFALCSVCAVADDAAQVKSFPDIHCKVTLPSSCEWLDITKEPYSKVQNARAGFQNQDGVMMFFLAAKLPEKLSGMKQIEIAGYEEGAIIPGVSKKISGEMITFRGLPCYELKMGLVSQKTEGAYRVFMVNGYCLQMQALNTETLKGDAKKAEELFSAFDLVGAPLSVVIKENSNEASEHDFSKKMGAFGFIGLVVALIAVIVVKVVGKKKKPSDSQ